MIEITLNEYILYVDEQRSILEIAEENNIFIPTLCHLPEIENSGYCRLCLVEVNGKLLPACSTKVTKGMVINTSSPRISDARKAVLELIFKEHYTNCPECIKRDSCELQKCAIQFDLKLNNSYNVFEKVAVREIIPSVNYDESKCILCMRCVNFLKKKCGKKILELKSGKLVGNENNCNTNVVEVCPTGALFLKSHRYESEG